MTSGGKASSFKMGQCPIDRSEIEGLISVILSASLGLLKINDLSVLCMYPIIVLSSLCGGEKDHVILCH